MNLKSFLLAAVATAAVVPATYAGDIMWGDRREAWLAAAESAKPELKYRVVRPQSVVRAVCVRFTLSHTVNLRSAWVI